MVEASLGAETARTNPYGSGPFRLVADMEDDVRIIRDLLTGLCRMADSFEDDGEAIATIAGLARDTCDGLETRRGELFRLTHPRRAEFEKEGWPGDRTATGLGSWGEALLSLKCAQDALDAAGEDDAEVDRAADVHHGALLALLTMSAPDGPSLTHKLEVFGKHQAWGFTEAPAIIEALAADARRFAGEVRHG